LTCQSKRKPFRFLPFPLSIPYFFLFIGWHFWGRFCCTTFLTSPFSFFFQESFHFFPLFSSVGEIFSLRKRTVSDPSWCFLDLFCRSLPFPFFFSFVVHGSGSIFLGAPPKKGFFMKISLVLLLPTQGCLRIFSRIRGVF